MKRMIFCFLLCTLSAQAQKPEITIRKLPVEASFRSMSVVNDSVIWLGGSSGTICKSTNRGLNFECTTVPGYDSTEFRSLYAFNENEAVIGNIGSPARILRTTDGGKNWNVVYENDSPEAFIDGIDFWDENEGVCFGDPIRSTMMLVRTHDGGKTWENVNVGSRPLLVEGEAAFAASNTTIRCYSNGKLMIATGGAITRLLVSENYGKNWSNFLPPILHGESSMGIFSFDFYDDKNAILVGGNYKKEEQQFMHVLYTSDGGVTWNEPDVPTRGYRECVQYLSAGTAIAVGPTGVEITYDGGKHWEGISDEKGFHVIGNTSGNTRAYFAGKGGVFGILDVKE